MKTLTGFSILLLSSLFIVLCGNHVNAKISENIYFQSMLMDSNGTVATDGEYTVTFSIWDGEYETNHKLWEEQHTVLVEDGTYSVSLGSIVSFLDPDQNGGQSDALTFAVPYYLGVKIQNDDYFTSDGKFPGFRSVITAFRSSTSAGNLVRSVSSSYTITEQDDVVFVSGDSQITLPSANNLYGRIITIKNIDPVHNTFIQTVNSETIDNINRDESNSGTAKVLPDQFDDLTVISNGQNWISLGYRKASFTTVTDTGTINAEVLNITDTAFINGEMTINNNLIVTGTTRSTHLLITQTTELVGNTIIGNSTSESLTINAVLHGQKPLTFEGGTADGIQTTIIVADPTEARQITIPDLSGTIVLKNFTTISDSRLLTTSDQGVVLISSTTNKDITITLPDPTGHPGLTYTIKKTNDSNNTVAISGYSIDGTAYTNMQMQYSHLEIVSDGNSWYNIGEKTDSEEQSTDSTEMNALSVYDISNTEIIYSGTKLGLTKNLLLMDNSGAKAMIVIDSQLDSSNYNHIYSTGNRSSLLTIDQFPTRAGNYYDPIDGDGVAWFPETGYTGDCTVRFPEEVIISAVRMYAKAITRYLTIDGVQVSDSKAFSSSGEYFEYQLYSPTATTSISWSGAQGDGNTNTGVWEFKIVSDPMSCITYSGELLSGDIVNISTTIEGQKIEYHFDSFSTSSGLLQSDKGFPNEWPMKAAKILKIDCYSDSAANINCTINGNPVFQNSIQTGSGWAYSGLVVENGNTINQDDILDISSDAAGTNLFVRIWYQDI